MEASCTLLSDGSVCVLRLPGPCSAEALRAAWGRETGLDPADFVFRSESGAELPAAGPLAAIPPYGASSMALTVEALGGEDLATENARLRGRVGSLELERERLAAALADADRTVEELLQQRVRAASDQQRWLDYQAAQAEQLRQFEREKSQLLDTCEAIRAEVRRRESKPDLPDAAGVRSEKERLLGHLDSAQREVRRLQEENERLRRETGRSSTPPLAAAEDPPAGNGDSDSSSKRASTKKKGRSVWPRWGANGQLPG